MIERRRTIYVAGASAERDRIAGFMQALREAGWKVTVDWVEAMNRMGPDSALPRRVAEDMASEDLSGVDEAAVLWLVVPEAETKGAWIEFGYALGTYSRPVIVASGPASTIFVHLANMRFETHAEALTAILEGRLG